MPKSPSCEVPTESWPPVAASRSGAGNRANGGAISSPCGNTIAVISSLAVQLLNGLAGASSLFLVAVGLSLIFGVTRIVNFAHGSMYMVGLYVAYSLVNALGASVLGFWGAVVLAAIAVGVLGAVVEIGVLRRVYHAPELFQLLATFAVVLMLRDAVLFLWGPEDLLGPRAPGMKGAIEVLGRGIPSYDVFLMFVGPLVLLLLWLLLRKTRLGVLIAIGEAFVVVVVGGMGSIPGAYLAALLIAEIKAICYGIGTVQIFGSDFAFSKLTLIVEFLVMAAVLIWRPWGLLGKAQGIVRGAAANEAPLRPMTPMALRGVLVVLAALAVLPLAAAPYPYVSVLMIDIMIAVLFAASLHFVMGPGGMASFGHAAYFGLGAYGAALLLKGLAAPMPLALLLAPLLALAGAALFGWFAVRLSGVYLAMLTLAFAQIVWSIVFQWDEVTGGSNGLVGVWPSTMFASKTAYFYLTLAFVGGSLFLLRRILLAPFGYAMRAGRDSPLRAEATGINVVKMHWIAFAIAGWFCGLAGALFAFAKGTISPETISVGRSVDALVMVLLGGVQSLAGPIVGAAAFTWLQDTIIRATDYWRAVLGFVILALVLAFPQG